MGVQLNRWDFDFYISCADRAPAQTTQMWMPAISLNLVDCTVLIFIQGVLETPLVAISS